MNTQKLQSLVTKSFDDFYFRRLENLDNFKLREALNKKNFYLSRIVSSANAGEIVEELLTKYLSSYDEKIFGDAFLKPIAKTVSGVHVSPSKRQSGQAFWEELTGDSEFYLKLIRLMKDYPAKHRREYEKSWGKAVNRFTKEFLLDFCNEDGSINWDKLVEFNSGKRQAKIKK